MLYGALLMLAVDALVFHTGIYHRYLNPISTGGQVNMMTWALHSKDADNAIAVFGDSRVAEGFSAKLANESGGKGSTRFINAAIPGTTPRVWYYLLRELDPHANRFAAVAIMLPNYNECGEDDLNERVLDFNYLAPILRYSDVFSFPGTFIKPETKTHVAISLILRGLAFKMDVLEFLKNPDKRIKTAAIFRKHWRDSNYNYAGHTDALDGLAVDPEAPGGLRFPPDATPETKRLLQAYMAQMKISQPMDSLAHYHKVWLDKIAARYRNSRTKVVIFEVPRGPLHYLKPQGPPSATLAELQKKDGFTLLPPETFGGMEHPEYFCDYLHMSGVGRRRFTAEFAPMLRQIAGTPSPATR